MSSKYKLLKYSCYTTNVTMSVTIRNFPATVAELRKRLKLREGGSRYLFATTLSDGSHALLRCRQL